MTDSKPSPGAPRPAQSSPPPAPLVAVDRAAAELRRGGILLIQAPGFAPLLVEAAEACGPETLARLERLAGAAPCLLVTGRRAAILGLPADDPRAAVALELSVPLEDALVSVLAEPDPNRDAVNDPAVAPPAGTTSRRVDPASPAEAAVQLAKLARLLPAAVAAEASISGDVRAWAHERNILTVDAAAIVTYQQTQAHSLRLVSEATVPLLGAEDTRILAFRPGDGGIEHLAIVIGTPDPEQPVLARLHSECFTGDLLGSLRCDCGDQLRGAIEAIAEAGAGVLLYLAQEGRGIGLVNKLRAYQLQDAGFDTMDANGQLGFDDDERIYLPAAEMLRQLGFSRVRLMTNNPAKVEALARHGVSVEERVPHVFKSNVYNLSYLRTKALKGGHLF